MTPTAEQMRVAIAEVCGWKACQPRASIKDTVWLSGINPRPDIVVSRFDATTGAAKEIGRSNGFETIPDYPGSLDAMHEAEKKLTPLQIHQYWTELVGVCAPSREYWRAAAHQRAEAFLRVTRPDLYRNEKKE